MILIIFIGIVILTNYAWYKVGHQKGYKDCEKEFNEILTHRERAERRLR